jgi:tRNA wybutosine-synthesizing protein 3
VAAAPGGAASGGSALITKGGRWLLAEHATITFALLQTALGSVGADAQSSSNMVSRCLSPLADASQLTGGGVWSAQLIFKHEPFIMHVVCRDLDAAKELLQWGIACGFRESGVVLGNKKIMCAIRTTANALEIPLGRLPADQPLLVTEEYLQWVVDIANEKFRANQRKTDALFAAFRAKFGPTGEVDDGAAPTLTQVKLDALHELEAVDLKVVGHSSVRYGSSIIVFGGQGTTATGTTTRVADVTIFTASDDGSRLERSYHHVGAPSSTTPSARMYHSAVMVGARMIVFGGRAGPTRPLNDLFAFDLESKQWEQLTPEGDAAPCPRWKHSACVGTCRSRDVLISIVGDG